jgi:hypothetical protein
MHRPDITKEKIGFGSTAPFCRTSIKVPLPLLW